MKTTVLVENNTDSFLCCGQHGLSLYIEAGDIKLLFDAGQDELFYTNAKKMGVSIEDVGLMVISHGHFDHGGGLPCFLQKNQKSMVYIHDLAFGDYYSRTSVLPYRYIGLEQNCKNNARLVRNAGYLRINDELELFSLPPEKNCGFRTKGNETLLMRKGDEYPQDSFLHEQNLIITNNGKRHLIAGCAHCGIANILEYAEKLCANPIDNVIGGFHLYSSGTKETESKEQVDVLAKRLKQSKAIFYTGHCTGKMGYVLLREIMGDQIRPISTGDVLEL
jgi:7,8-dihydropterin-6-yl-methyl-4-(beta-D-ribofuranosyl)aminobenzene 5'-phosphate synthase